ncbi:MAG: phosphatidylglycerophosphatase A [Finegoldia sp.]|nr:phosphatidylglycerophosphatase A [Finegoldia sp.]
MGKDKTKAYPYTMEELKKLTLRQLDEKGVKLGDIAEIVYILQKDYCQGLDMDVCRQHVDKVLEKREVLHAILTGIAIDKACEQNLFDDPIQKIIADDEGLYGIDEIMALSISNIYGSIGLTNFGYLDKNKLGIIKDLDEEKSGGINTFLDDIIAAIAAAAASRLAHSRYN